MNRALTVVLLVAFIASTLAFSLGSLGQGGSYGKSLGEITIYKVLVYKGTYVKTVTLTTKSNASNATTKTATETYNFTLTYTVEKVQGLTLVVNVQGNIPPNLTIVSNGTHVVNLLSPLSPYYPYIPPQFLTPINITNITAIESVYTNMGVLISGTNSTSLLVTPFYNNSELHATLIDARWGGNVNVVVNAQGYLKSLFGQGPSQALSLELVNYSGPITINVNSSKALQLASSQPLLYAVKTFNPFSQSLTVTGYLQIFAPFTIYNDTYVMAYYSIRPIQNNYVASPQGVFGYPTFLFIKIVNTSTDPSLIFPFVGEKSVVWGNTTVNLIGQQQVSVLGNKYSVYIYTGIENRTQNVTLWVTPQGVVVRELVTSTTQNVPILELELVKPILLPATQTYPPVVQTGGPTTLAYQVVNPKESFIIAVVFSLIIVILAVLFRLR
jgi:hypothetical protein